MSTQPSYFHTFRNSAGKRHAVDTASRPPIDYLRHTDAPLRVTPMPTASPLADYIAQATASGSDLNTGFVACLASLEHIRAVSPEVAAAVVAELDDQTNSLKMIASENYSSLAVQLAMGNLFTDKYAEGYPYHRFYAGCENVDAVEGRAVELAKDLFGAEHAYVQPHSGADANLVAYWAILAAKVQSPFMENVGQTDPTKLSNTDWAELRHTLGNQRMLGMNYYSGGHLSHGYRLNASATMFEVQSYDVDRETNLLDYDAIRDHAKAFRPLILLAGYSAYSRKIDFSIFREIADEVGAVLMVDMAHFAGLVAGKVDGFTGPYDPVAHAHVVTTTTHKTLRGPRGGMVLSTDEFGEYVDKGCPMVLGGPMPHVMAAKAVAFTEAATPEFKAYARAIVDNASALAAACIDEGMDILTGGTDNHLMLANVAPTASPDAKPSPPCARQTSPSTATASPSTPTARGTPPAFASERPPSPAAAWARQI